MALNWMEQQLLDYVQGNPEEKRFWEEKVRSVAAAHKDDHAAAMALDGELWHYYKERTEVVRELAEVARREGLRRTSMRNLAEYLLRVWTPPQVKPKGAPKNSAQDR